MKKLWFIFIFLTFSKLLLSQGFGGSPQLNKYSASKVINPTYGITMYEKLNLKTGGDSVRNDRKGYAAQEGCKIFMKAVKFCTEDIMKMGNSKFIKIFTKMVPLKGPSRSWM